MSSSFQTQSVPLLHMVSRVIPDTTILFLDTGYHFPETLAFRDRLAREWNLNIRSLSAVGGGADPASQGPELYLRDPDLCCHINKVEPMRQAAGEYDALISGIRRDQTRTRADAAVIEERQGVLRIHPILSWSERDVWTYIHKHDLPHHPLFEQGYTSVGCAPCTRPVQIGEDARAGRWAGSSKNECGLHLKDPSDRTPPQRRSSG